MAARKKFACDICSHTYIRAEHLTRHKQTAHPPPGADARPFRCSYAGCSRTFARHDVLNRHRAGHLANKSDDQRHSDNSVDIEQAEHRLAIAVDALSNLGKRKAASVQAEPAQKDGKINKKDRSSMHSITGQEDEEARIEHHDIRNAETPMTDTSIREGRTNGSTRSLHNSQAMLLEGSPSAQSHSAHKHSSIQKPHHKITQSQLSTPFRIDDGYPHTDNAMVVDPLIEASLFDAGMDLTGFSWMFNADGNTPTDQSWSNDPLGDPGTLTSATTFNNESSASLLNYGAGTPSWLSPSAPRTVPQRLELDQEPILHALPSSRYQSPDSRASPSAAGPNNVEKDSAWPHAYLPSNNRDFNYVELTSFRLSRDRQDVGDGDGTIRSSDMNRGHSNPVISIEEEDEEYVEFPSETTSKSWSTHWANLPVGNIPKPIVTERTRAKLFDLLRWCCSLPWSMFRLGSSTENFLTTRELSSLLAHYFTEFHPRRPFCHLPTFSAEEAPPLLFVMMISIALVYVSRLDTVNRVAALRLSLALGELARLGIVSSVELDRRGFLQLANTQTWLLQSTLALGGADKRMYQLAERNRSGIITFARRLGLFSARHSRSLKQIVEAMGLSDDGAKLSLDEVWKRWIQEELRIRLGWAVYVYDQEYSTLLDISPMLVPVEVVSSLPCSERLWAAPTASHWLAVVEEQTGREQRQHLMSQSQSPASGVMDDFCVSQDDLHTLLRSLLQIAPSQRQGQKVPNIKQPNRFSAMVVACTLYRMRWDSAKLTLLLGQQGSFGNSLLRLQNESATTPLERAIDDVFHQVSAAAATTRQNPSRSQHPILFDVEILHLHCEMHFQATPRLSDMLRNLAGRHGMRSYHRMQAHQWLRDTMLLALKRPTLRRVVSAAARVVSRCSFDFTTKKANISSVITVVSLFHSALALYAFVRYASESFQQSSLEQPEQVQSETDRPPRIAESLWTSQLHSSGIQLGDSQYEAQSAFAQAWIVGSYTDESGQRHAFPYHLGFAVSVNQLILIPKDTSTHHNIEQAAGKVLRETATLLSQHSPWGLADSFSDVLLRLANTPIVD